MPPEDKEQDGSAPKGPPTVALGPGAPAMPTIELRGEPTLPPLPAHVRLPSIPHYDVVAFIGQGGMGRVFKAIDQRLQRPVALKLIRGDDRVLVERFLREARAQA